MPPQAVATTSLDPKRSDDVAETDTQEAGWEDTVFLPYYISLSAIKDKLFAIAEKNELEIWHDQENAVLIIKADSAEDLRLGRAAVSQLVTSKTPFIRAAPDAKSKWARKNPREDKVWGQPKADISLVGKGYKAVPDAEE